jgi:hypothetical protein
VCQFPRIAEHEWRSQRVCRAFTGEAFHRRDLGRTMPVRDRERPRQPLPGGRPSSAPGVSRSCSSAPAPGRFSLPPTARRLGVSR